MQCLKDSELKTGMHDYVRDSSFYAVDNAGGILQRCQSCACDQHVAVRCTVLLIVANVLGQDRVSERNASRIAADLNSMLRLQLAPSWRPQ